ncbi:MAG TPA: hypothetical protein VLF67_01785 [Candidatus Saccharimonas sp.]|nr:hypothetical protein [Candidatus Saccharimonas sp.]
MDREALEAAKHWEVAPDSVSLVLDSVDRPQVKEIMPHVIDTDTRVNERVKFVITDRWHDDAERAGRPNGGDLMVLVGAVCLPDGSEREAWIGYYTGYRQSSRPFVHFGGLPQRRARR